MKSFCKRSLAVGVLLCMLCYLFAFFPVRLEAAAGRYSGYGEAASLLADETETINFTRREDSYIETVKGVPQYVQLAQYPNSCGAVGGAMIVGFYDKYYEDLIPNYSSSVSSGAYKRTDSVYVPKLMGDLYTLMRTNVDDVGVSQTDCINGLTSYVQSHGRAISYSSIMNSNKINQSAYINAINSNHPSLLFCNTMQLCTLTASSNSEKIEKRTYVGDHIVVAYGYAEIKYYNDNGLFRTDGYLRISSGLGTVGIGFIKINTTNWCDAAYSVTVS